MHSVQAMPPSDNDTLYFPTVLYEYFTEKLSLTGGIFHGDKNLCEMNG